VPNSASPFAVEPYSFTEARTLAEELGVSGPVAVTLVRRGYRTPEEARSFLAADESHPPSAFEGMEAAVERVHAAIEAGQRITVHGDFDVDGVCATTLMVSTLRELGAEVDWFIPNRLEDGYGLSIANVRRLAERGTQLLLTVDCGITSVEEVALAGELGIEPLCTRVDNGGKPLEGRDHLVEILANVAPGRRAFVGLTPLSRIREHELVARLDGLDALFQIVARHLRSTCQRFGSWCSSNSRRVIQPRIMARVKLSFSGRNAK